MQVISAVGSLLKRFGDVSDGMAEGLTRGFESGRSLDYVYANQARGRNWFGKLLDRWYLNSPGWKGIRERKSLLVDSVSKAAEALVQERPLEVVDLACGGAQYCFELAQNTTLRFTLNDIDQSSLELVGKKLEGHPNRQQFSQCSEDLLSLSETSELAGALSKAHIVILSGLHELYPDNQSINNLLHKLAAIMPAGAKLIYTGQSWHPQLETIARTLNNRHQTRWIMRRRTTAELDALCEAAGFRTEDRRTTARGIFSVTVSSLHKIEQGIKEPLAA